jgi:hypothetical protein
MNHIIDHEGVMLDIQYTRSADDGSVDIESVFALDGDYRKTGPNLARMLDAAIVMVGENRAEPLFNTFLEQLP